MKRVVIANTYFYRLDEKQWKFKQPYPPLATLIAVSVCRNAGFDTTFFDTNLLYSSEEIYPVLEEVSPSYFILYDDGFNYLSKMCLTVMREAAFQMIRKADLAGCTIIVSSSDATDHFELYLDAGADFIIRGEAEETLRELLAVLENHGDVKRVNGLAYRDNGTTLLSSPRVVLKNLDTLPLPAWDSVDMESYRKIWKKHHGYFSLNIATTRGCPYKCNWCAKPIYGNRYNSRTPEQVIEEIDYLLKNYAPDHFWMCDDIFALKPGWIQSFNNLVHEKNLKFRYKIQSRADLLLEADHIEALSKSGAETIWIGAESGSQKILDAMDKGTTIEQIFRATQLLKSKGIRVAFFLQFGYLGETAEDVQKTIKMVLELMPDEVGISVSYPLPGTKFYENVKDQLKEKQNWSDSDDLAMMFQNTFNSDYYKILHRYVHSVYRQQQGVNTILKTIRQPHMFSLKDLKSIAGAFYFGFQTFYLNQKLNGHQQSRLMKN